MFHHPARRGALKGWARPVLIAVVALGGMLAASAATCSAVTTHSVAASKSAPAASAASLHIPAVISELPVPPTAPSDAAGSCTTDIDPRGTGCVSPDWGALGSPGFYWDSRYVLLGLNYAGAPATGPASVYSGPQVVVENVDGHKFTDGTVWKCITCGVPAANEQGINTRDLTYPPAHALPGDRAVLVGNGILSCGGYIITDPRCTPQNTHIYPIDLDGQPLGGVIGGAQTREWRLSPDGVHLAWNALVQTATAYDEFAFVGRLSWDAASQRYDLLDVTELFNSSPQYLPYLVGPGNTLTWNAVAMIGEFRGWSSNGQDVLGIQSFESDSVDAFETSLATGKSRPLTQHAEYTDPMFMSPNGKWMLSEEVLGSGRLGFLSAMQGIPPLTDQGGATGYVSGIRNNSQRRFFLPYLVSTSSGAQEQVNAGGDPNWNAAADPVWLANSTAVVWAENQVVSPACGGSNPLPCPASAEPGGRRSRVMVARFPALAPSLAIPPKPISDIVPWGTPYIAGAAFPVRPHLPAGTYTLRGTISGSASVVITTDASNARITEIQVSYANFSDKRGDIINGTESTRLDADSPFAPLTWNEDLTLSGRHVGTKVTSPGGFTLSPLILENIFQATGTLTTTIDGTTYTQPGNGD
jgi:hypothetical protein